MADHKTNVGQWVTIPHISRSGQLGPCDCQEALILNRNYLDEMAKGSLIVEWWALCEIFELQVLIDDFREVINSVLFQFIDIIVSHKAQRHEI